MKKIKNNEMITDRLTEQELEEQNKDNLEALVLDSRTSNLV